MNFLIALFIISTVLFTGAKLMDIPIWYVVAAEFMFFVAWISTKAWLSTAQQLVNQASYMGWVFVGKVKDERGFRDTLLERSGVIARVSFTQKCVYLSEPVESGPYKDFVEIENYLANQ